MHLNYVAASFIGIGLRCRTGSAHRGDERIHVVRSLFFLISRGVSLATMIEIVSDRKFGTHQGKRRPVFPQGSDWLENPLWNRVFSYSRL
jgi:hypothetical protein